MRGKVAVSFMTMSLLLMIVYLIAIAAPNLPWTPNDYQHETGSWTDQGQTVYCNAYVAWNNVWETSKWNIRTYHWARVWNLPENGQLRYEFRHAAGAPADGFIDGDTIEDPGNVTPGTDEWEHARHMWSWHTDPLVMWSWNPYTGVKKAGAGAWASDPSVTVTVLPH